MKRILVTIILVCSLIMAKEYADQIKVVDRCVRLTEPLKIEKLGLKGMSASMLDPVKSRAACRQSLKQHPNDPHIQFLLARAYSMGAEKIAPGMIPQKLALKIKKLNGIPPRHDKAFALAQASCKKGDSGGCMLLGYYYYTGKYPKRDMKKAYLLWLWSCSLGNPHACQNLSEMIENREAYVSAKREEADAYSVNACLSGLYPRACVFLSDHWSWMKDKRFKKDRQLKSYVDFHACVYGNSNACYFLFKDDNNASIEKKLYAFKYACNNGNAKACSDAGAIYMKKSQNRVNVMMAKSLFETACELGDLHGGCWYAGSIMMNGTMGIPQDVPLGIKYLEKSCLVGNNSFACYDLATFYLYTKEKRYQNREKAIPLLKRACKRGNLRAIGMGCQEGIDFCCKQDPDVRKR